MMIYLYSESNFWTSSGLGTDNRTYKKQTNKLLNKKISTYAFCPSVVGQSKDPPTQIFVVVISRIWYWFRICNQFSISIVSKWRSIYRSDMIKIDTVEVAWLSRAETCHLHVEAYCTVPYLCVVRSKLMSRVRCGTFSVIKWFKIYFMPNLTFNSK